MSLKLTPSTILDVLTSSAHTHGSVMSMHTLDEYTKLRIENECVLLILLRIENGCVLLILLRIENARVLLILLM